MRFKRSEESPQSELLKADADKAAAYSVFERLAVALCKCVEGRWNFPNNISGDNYPDIWVS